MPRIREYVSEAAQRGIDTRPLEQAGQAAAQGGYYQANFIRQGAEGFGRGLAAVGQAVETYNEQNEMSALAADMSTLHAELNVAWNEAAQKADGSDPHMADNFMEQVNQKLDALSEKYTTQKAQRTFTTARAGIWSDLYQKVHTDQSKLAGSNAINSVFTFKNNMSNALRNDPSGWENALGLTDVTLGGLVSSFGLGADDAMKLTRDVKKELAVSTFYGIADRDPEAAREALRTGKFSEYITGGEAKELENYANHVDRQNAAQANAADVQQRREAKQLADADAAEISASVIGEDGTMSVPQDFYKRIREYATQHAGVAGVDSKVRALSDLGRRITKELASGVPAVTDPATFEDMRRRMELPASDPNSLQLTELDRARADGRLSDRDYRNIRTYLVDAGKNPQRTADQKVFNRWAGSLKGFFDKSSAMRVDAIGKQRFFEFSQAMQERFDAGRAANIPANDLLSPASKDYIGKDLAQFQISKEQQRAAFRQMIQGTVQPLTPAQVPTEVPSPRQPGESAADYLRRIGGK